MRKKNIIVRATALLMSSILIFSGCQNSRYDSHIMTEEQTTAKVSDKNDSNKDTENKTERETEKETEKNTDKEETTTKKPVDKEEPTTSPDYNTPDTEYTDAQKKIQQEFDTFMTKLYVEVMSNNLVSTHFDLDNPEAYGITEYDSIWGSDNLLEDYKKALSDDKTLYNQIKTFDYKSLTYEQQLIYDTMIEFLENSFTLDEFYYFGENFSPNSGTQFQLNLILSEYRFNDKEDIENYLEVISTCDDYINSLIEFEKWRAEKGYAMTDNAIDDVIEQCNDILAASEPAFLPVIREIIDGCDFLTSEEKDSFKTQIATLATENVIPAYQAIIDCLTEIKGKRSVEGGLCKYENGKKYYEGLIRLYTGSDKTIEELIKTIEDNIKKDLLAYSYIAMADPDLSSKLEKEPVFVKTEPNEILTYLMDELEKDFPSPVCKDYKLKYVAKSMESSSNPAFYLLPPTDNYKHNIIYVNNSKEYESIDLFPLLAHEGMPGHMYQNNYFLSLNPHPIRSLLNFNGYAEGWAQYVEHYSYKWSGIDKNVADTMVIDDTFGFALYSRVDIGVNYEGWDIDDIKDYLKDYLSDVSFAGDLYDLFINDPGVYLQYYIGEVEILELKEKAEKQLDDDFNIKEFHEFFLEVGPTYYEIIEDRMDYWMLEY